MNGEVESTTIPLGIFANHPRPARNESEAATAVDPQGRVLDITPWIVPRLSLHGASTVLRAGETWETLSYTVLGLCGWIAIALCLA